jgi:hypothetical protein
MTYKESTPQIQILEPCQSPGYYPDPDMGVLTKEGPKGNEWQESERDFSIDTVSWTLSES